MSLRARDAFYAAPPDEPALVAARRVLGACAELLALSAGEVEDPRLLDDEGLPTRKGLLSEPLFGPLEVLRCRCGLLSGAGDAGRTCDRCGVLCGDPSERARRWAHLELAGGLIHPALAPAMALALGCSPDTLWTLSPSELRAGLEAPEAADRLGPGIRPSELILTRLPVSPPLLRGDAALDGGVHMPGPETARLQVLLGLALRGRLWTSAEQPAPPWEQQAMQAALCGQIADREGAERTWGSWRSRPASLYTWPRDPIQAPGEPDLEELADPSDDDVSAVAFAGPERILVARGDRLHVLSLPDGAHGPPLRLPGQLLAVDAADGLAHVQVLSQRLRLDLASGAVRAATGLDGADLEEIQLDLSWLRRPDAALGVPLFDLSGAAGQPVHAAEGRHVWVTDETREGGAYSLETGLRQIDPFQLLSAAELQEEEPRALSWSPGRGFLVLAGRALCRGGRILAELPDEPDAAAFSAGGERLLTLRGRRWQVRAVATGELLAHGRLS